MAGFSVVPPRPDDVVSGQSLAGQYRYSGLRCESSSRAAGSRQRPGGLQGVSAGGKGVADDVQSVRVESAEHVGLDRVHRQIAALEDVESLARDREAQHAPPTRGGAATKEP